MGKCLRTLHVIIIETYETENKIAIIYLKKKM